MSVKLFDFIVLPLREKLFREAILVKRSSTENGKRTKRSTSTHDGANIGTRGRSQTADGLGLRRNDVC